MEDYIAISKESKLEKSKYIIATYLHREHHQRERVDLCWSKIGQY